MIKYKNLLSINKKEEIKDSSDKDYLIDILIFNIYKLLKNWEKELLVIFIYMKILIPKNIKLQNLKKKAIY